MYNIMLYNNTYLKLNKKYYKIINKFEEKEFIKNTMKCFYTTEQMQYLIKSCKFTRENQNKNSRKLNTV